MVMKKSFFVVLSLLLVSLLLTGITACSGGGANSDPQLVSIEVAPADSFMAVNTTQQLRATGIYSDNSKKDLTQTVEWSSSDPTIALVGTASDSVSSGDVNAVIESALTTTGTVYAAGEGTTTIKASWGKLWGSCSLTVKRSSLVSITVTPTNPSIAKGTNQQFTATGTFSDNSTQDITAALLWSSSNTSVATVSNAAGAQGFATTLAAGTTTITAETGSISGSTTLTVNGATLASLAITPVNPSIGTGTSQQFTATGTYSDNTTQNLTASVTWSSSSTGVATISNTAGANGFATSIAAGSTTITATFGSLSATTTLTVKPATLVSIAVTPTNPTIAKGTNQQFTATGTYSDNTTQNLTASVVWSSSNTAVATISNAVGSNGLATSVGAGSTTITATSGSISGSTTLTVNAATLVSIAVSPTNPSIAKGTNQQFTATGTYSDNTTQNLTATVTWSSSNTAVATISNAAGSNGLAASAGSGTTTITATSGSISGSTTLTVNAASLVSIAVSPTNPTIAKGTSKQFTATGSYSDGTSQNLTAAVTWSSSNTAVATISNAAGSNGLAASVGAGTTTIKATSGSISGSTTLTVTAATLVSIAVSPANASIGTGATKQFTATGSYSDGTSQNLTAAVTWSSSNTAVATISNAAGSNGLATGVAVGSSTIKAVSGTVTGSATLTVVDRSASLSWTAPTTNVDGTALTDLAGYKIYYGISSGNYTTTINAGNVTTYKITNLAPGTYYFAVTAVNTAGAESAYSNEGSKTIQ